MRLPQPSNSVRESGGKAKLGKVFGKDKVTMLEMNKHLARHLA